MKKLIVALGVLSTITITAQKKEINAAHKALESNDFATANSNIAAADAKLNGRMESLDPATMEQYYAAKGLGLLKAGKTSEAAPYLAKIGALGKSKIYSGKDASKNKVYYVGKTAADASGISGLKEETYIPTSAQMLAQQIQPSLQQSYKAAADAYNAKNYKLSADKFVETYQLYQAMGNPDRSVLMNAAIAYSNANELQKSSDIYNDLINSGYTGVETIYKAKNTKTGTVEQFDKTTFDQLKKLGATSGYSDFASETSKSVEQDLYEQNARNLLALKKYEEANAMAEKGLKKFPKSEILSSVRGYSMYNSGKGDEFITLLKQQVAQNPNNIEAWSNLAEMQKHDPAKFNDAVAAYEKVIALDPKNINAYTNLTYLMMGDDEKAVDSYNALVKAKKTEEANKVIAERKARFAKALPYAEKWYQLDPNNSDVVSLLKGFYTSSKNEAKAAEMRAKEATLKK